MIYQTIISTLQCATAVYLIYTANRRLMDWMSLKAPASDDELDRLNTALQALSNKVETLSLNHGIREE